MKKSPFPLDHILGLSWYISDSDGIGGRLRTEPEDFVVEELSDYPGTEESGPYLICRLTKKNWDQQRSIKEIANRLGISHQRIGFAGTKDKRAITTQYISIYKGDSAAISNLHIPDISIEPAGYSQQQISLGKLNGNRFTITLADHPLTNPDTIPELLHSLSGGIPNYFGYQRFGVQRPITHLTGLDMIHGDFKKAVETFVGTPSDYENEETSAGRKFYRETGDAKAALHEIPVRLSLERSLLHHLVNKPDDYAGAFHSFPRTLRSMFVSAVQSWLFNRALSMRLEEGRGLSEVGVGDRILFPEGKSDAVTTATLRMAAMQIKRNRCSIALFMPGSEPVESTGPDDRNLAWLMEEEGINAGMFASVSSFLETKFSGALRPISINPEILVNTEENKSIFSFSLEPGQYATTVLREIMKVDPIFMT
jgi:tRNA pseudouridine13 synthase